MHCCCEGWAYTNNYIVKYECTTACVNFNFNDFFVSYAKALCIFWCDVDMSFCCDNAFCKFNFTSWANEFAACGTSNITGFSYWSSDTDGTSICKGQFNLCAFSNWTKDGNVFEFFFRTYNCYSFFASVLTWLGKIFFLCKFVTCTKKNVKVFYTFHDCWTFTGHCTYFDYVDCPRWKTGCHHCPQKTAYPASYGLDRSRENYRDKRALFTGVRDMTLVTPSHWLAGLVKESFLKDYPVEVVHNTIDTSVFKPTPGDFRQKHGLEEKKIVLGVAANWEKRKGLQDLLTLSETLGEPYRVVLVGLKGKVPPSVLAIPRTDSPRELAEIYTAADVFVNPTYEDNYPTVNLEAAACGTPVITYRTGGSVESVPQDRIVEKGDLRGLEAMIRRVCGI